MFEEAAVTACLLIIGNEILSGRTRDANLAYLGQALNDIGVRLKEARVIADEEDVIVAHVTTCREVFDYVFTTGGIGPTHDDITSASVAKAFGVPLVRNAEAFALLEQHYAPGELNEARAKMADIPQGATLIDNPVSKAPGFQIENVVVLPGVPVIMRAMFEGMRHRLRHGTPVASRTIAAFTLEGVLATDLSAVQQRFGNVEIGSYPFVRDRRLGVSVVLRSIDTAALDQATAAVAAMVRSLGAEPFEETVAGNLNTED